MDTGELSRNRCFEAFHDPVVREARKRHERLKRLAGIVRQAGTGAWNVVLKKIRSKPATWRVTCQSVKWKLRWAAHLCELEIDLLCEDPEIGIILAGCRVEA